MAGKIRTFTTQEQKELTEWYKNHTDRLDLDELSKKLNRTTTYLCRKARGLGLTKFGRKPKDFIEKATNRLCTYNDTTAGKKTRDEALLLAQELNRERHHKPFLGKKHSKEMKEKMSARVKSEWANPHSALNSEKNKQIHSDIMAKRQTSGTMRCAYSRGKQGKRDDLDGMYFRSSWEANYARYLNLLIKCKQLYRWEYEPDTFWFDKIKRGTRSYLPDFKLWDTETSEPYYVEIKGWMDDKSKTKLNRMRIYYPDVKIKLVGEREYKELKAQVSKFIGGWE